MDVIFFWKKITLRFSMYRTIIVPENLLQGFGKNGMTILVTFSISDYDNHIVRIDVSNFKIKAFGKSYSCSIEGGSDRKILGVLYDREKRGYF